MASFLFLDHIRHGPIPLFSQSLFLLTKTHFSQIPRWLPQVFAQCHLLSDSPLFSSVQLLSRVRLFATPWTAAHQASLSITNSWTLLKLVFIKSVMPSNHLILCCTLLLLPSVFPSIRVFSKESVLRIRWPRYWPFSFSISPFHEYSGLISFRMYWFDVQLILITM